MQNKVCFAHHEQPVEAVRISKTHSIQSPVVCREMVDADQNRLKGEARTGTPPGEALLFLALMHECFTAFFF